MNYGIFKTGYLKNSRVFFKEGVLSIDQERRNKNHCYRSITVDVVIFAGGKFRENVGKTFHAGVIFMKLLLFPS